MTQKEKISYMRIALSLIHIGLKDVDVDKLITIYEAVNEKKGSLTIKDIVEIELRVEKRNKDF
ncbi:MAG: hypothetical protein WC998_07580 [Candidatus Paceibacterota bacterium]|jgi:hypothetical protein